jgi:hypothetical protein
MNHEAKEQYMDTLRKQYLKATKKRKGELLDEYCRNTGMERKYVIKKIRYTVKVKGAEERKPRQEHYDGLVKASLVTLWNIFDRPCGQRLQPLLVTETERLRHLRELACTNDVAKKLTCISSAAIDRALAHEKEVLRLRQQYARRRNPLLCRQVPVKTSADFDRSVAGQIQIDCVEHCGTSASGEYVNSLSTTDVFSGWWEGEAIMGKGQERALTAVKHARDRTPFAWIEMHPDNGTNLLNYHMYAYAQEEKLAFSRSRPYKKNDNCFVEQKNSTHIRQVVGYLRYDTPEEFDCINDLYRNELRIFKNFFQPVMKLREKMRVGGRIHKKYDKPKTPYHRLMESNQISKAQKRQLTTIYESQNPAALKRAIDSKLATLYKIYQKKKGSCLVNTDKRLTPSLVSYYMMQPV